ncbi:MAG: hypothetical protein JWM56_649 [Candidatus Peribacteria bacterium]|nr:hypothetical protein [Candidatus Peribacteria bacterium]
MCERPVARTFRAGSLHSVLVEAQPDRIHAASGAAGFQPIRDLFPFVARREEVDLAGGHPAPSGVLPHLSETSDLPGVDVASAAADGLGDPCDERGDHDLRHVQTSDIA